MGRIWVNRRVGTDDNTIRTFLSSTMNPVCGTEESVCSAVAGIEGVEAFDTVVVVSLKQRHQERLG